MTQSEYAPCPKRWRPQGAGRARCSAGEHRCSKAKDHGGPHLCQCGTKGTNSRSGIALHGREPFKGFTREQLAWAAGFFDGEGTSYANSAMSKGKLGHAVTLAIAQTDPEPLERFKAAVGGMGRVEGPFNHKNSTINHSPQWFYRLTSFEEVQAVAGLLWEFLSSPKRGQFQRTLRTFVEAPRMVHRKARSRLGN